MRVRYQMVGKAEVAECDLSDKKARKLYSELERNGVCEWAELVGEDDDNYMDIIDKFYKAAEDDYAIGKALNKKSLVPNMGQD